MCLIGVAGRLEVSVGTVGKVSQGAPPYSVPGLSQYVFLSIIRSGSDKEPLPRMHPQMFRHLIVRQQQDMRSALITHPGSIGRRTTVSESPVRVLL